MKIVNSKLVLPLLVLFAFILRLIHIGSKPLWYDETWTALDIIFPADNLLVNAGSAMNPPLFFWLTRITTELFGIHAVSLRIVPLLFGVLGVIIAYHVGRHLKDKSLGLLFAFIIAINPFSIQMSQEARTYAATTTIVLLVLYFLIRYLNKSSIKNIIFLSLSVVISFCTHFTLLVMVAIIPFIVILFQYRDIFKKWFLRNSLLYIIINSLGFTLILPALRGAVANDHWQTVWESYWNIPFKILQIFVEFTGYLRAIDHFSFVQYLYLVFLTFFVIVFIYGLLKMVKDKQYVFLIFFGFVLFTISAYLGYKKPGYINSRVLSPFLFGQLGIFSYGLYYLSSKCKVFALSAIFIISVVICINLYTYSGNPNADGWREAFQYIKKHEKDDDKILMFPIKHHNPTTQYRYYYQYINSGELEYVFDFNPDETYWVLFQGIAYGNDPMRPIDNELIDKVRKYKTSEMQFGNTLLWKTSPEKISQENFINQE